MFCRVAFLKELEPTKFTEIIACNVPRHMSSSGKLYYAHIDISYDIDSVFHVLIVAEYTDKESKSQRVLESIDVVSLFFCIEFDSLTIPDVIFRI